MQHFLLYVVLVQAIPAVLKTLEYINRNHPAPKKLAYQPKRAPRA